MQRDEMMRRRLEGETYGGIAREMGISRQRVQQILSPPKTVRLAVLERAGQMCEACGGGFARLHVHHKDSIGVEPERYEDLANLEALCQTCHRWAHGGGPPAPRAPREDPEGSVPGELGEEADVRCPTHGVALVCPGCMGAKGGRVSSPRKAAASRANAVRATARHPIAADPRE